MTYLAKQLNRTDSEDIDEIIQSIEKSFDISFKQEELLKIDSIRELTELICSKIKLDQNNSCTTQQAFYKFKNAYLSTQNNIVNIKTESLLRDIFPKNNRKQNLKNLELELGIQLGIIQPPAWLAISLLLLFVISSVILFYHSTIGAIGIAFSFVGGYIASKTANTFTIKTVKELIQLLVKNNYSKSRNSNIYNPKEVENIVVSYFIDELGYDRSKFEPNSSFGLRK